MENDIKIINDIDEYSYAAYYVDVKFNDTKLSNATCFFYKYKDKDYLVTNWHVVSGRNSINGKCLDTYGAIPNTLSIYLFTQEDDYLYRKYMDVKLYDENEEPIWYEWKAEERHIDVAVIPVIIPQDYQVYWINQLGDPFNEDTNPEVREDVFILGYPFGMDGGGGLPIWKRGSIASEPSVDIEGLPMLYVDTASRSGMSGSPVIYKERRPVTIMNSAQQKFGRYKNKFIGVYSGRIGAEDEFKAQLGIVWKYEVIEKIIETKEKKGLTDVE